MNKSNQIEKQIIELYTFEGLYYPPSYSDLIQLLKYNRVSGQETALYPHWGYEINFDETLICLFYDDKSVLIVNCNGGIIAR